MELHHIEQRADGGEDSFDNCLPLCFDCHAEVNNYNDRHPKGRKFTPTELKQHRDSWYSKVQNSFGLMASPEHIKLDQELFTKIRQILPSDGVIRFVRYHDYGGSFDRKVHYDLHRFLEYCELPEFEFLDADLEGLRAKLFENINKFTQAIGLYTFPIMIGDGSWNQIPPDPMENLGAISFYHSHAKTEEEFNRMVEDQRRRIFNMHHELNDFAEQVVETYDEFVRLGRRKLAI